MFASIKNFLFNPCSATESASILRGPKSWSGRSISGRFLEALESPDSAQMKVLKDFPAIPDRQECIFFVSNEYPLILTIFNWGPEKWGTTENFWKNEFHWTRVRNQSFCQWNEINGERLEILDAVTSDPKTSLQCVPYFAIWSRNWKSCRGVPVRA